MIVAVSADNVPFVLTVAHDGQWAVLIYKPNNPAYRAVPDDVGSVYAAIHRRSALNGADHAANIPVYARYPSLYLGGQAAFAVEDPAVLRDYRDCADGITLA